MFTSFADNMDIFIIYIFLFMMSLVASAVSIPLFKKIGIKLDWYDDPGTDLLKIHKKPIPYIGGAGIILGFALVLSLAAVLGIGEVIRIISVLSLAIVVFLFGFWDDVRWKKTGRPMMKLSFLLGIGLVCAVVLDIAGINFKFLTNPVLAVLLAGFYIIGAMTSVNMQDGIDGLAGSLAGITLIGFVVLSLVFGNLFFASLAIGLLGGIVGFLVFNWNPAKVFMGDSGSHLLGFLLAVLAIGFTGNPFLSEGKFFGPVFMIGLPVFDAALAISRRLISGQSPFLGDRRHLYDILLLRGLSVKRTVFVCCIIQVVMVILGIAIYV